MYFCSLQNLLESGYSWVLSFLLVDCCQKRHRDVQFMFKSYPVYEDMVLKIRYLFVVFRLEINRHQVCSFSVYFGVQFMNVA